MEAPRSQKTPPLGFTILGPLDGSKDGAAATGNETHDAIRLGSERRRTFGGLEDPETAARARSHEEHAPAPRERPRESESRFRNAGRLGLDRGHDPAVFLREKLEEIAG